MQFKSFALLALGATGAVANVDIEERQAIPTPTDALGSSILSVLVTAIPPSVLLQAATNTAAFATSLASALSAGQTPDWYQALPSDVKSNLPKLYPVSIAATTTPNPLASASSSASESLSSIRASISASISAQLNTTTISTVSSATLKSSGASGASNAASATSKTTGAASHPTAVIGAGVAGALGVIGMLAL